MSVWKLIVLVIFIASVMGFLHWRWQDEMETGESHGGVCPFCKQPVALTAKVCVRCSAWIADEMPDENERERMKLA